MRQLLFAVVFVLASAPISGAAQQRPASSDSSESRRALIIGNSAYQERPLLNPVNDARAMAKALNEVGFTVRIRTNLSRSQMREEIRKFGEELRDPGSVGLFFFAGHGVQVNGRNYLIPVGSDIRREHEVEDEAVDANFVLSTMEYAKARMNIVILDACRDNPFAGSFRSTMRGLAPMNAPGSTIIAYATAPGQTASDGDGVNGLYTKHLVEQITAPGLSISDLFINVRNAVQRESGGRQTPWELASLTEKFYFKSPPTAAAAAPSPGASQADVEKAVQAALKKRDEEEAARRAAQQSEIEQAVLAALKKREDEAASAQTAARERDAAKAAVERLNKELAELRAAREAEKAQAEKLAAARETAPASQQLASPQENGRPVPATPESKPTTPGPAQVAPAAPSSRPKPVVNVGGRVERPDVRVGDQWKYQITDRFTSLKSVVLVEVASVTENRIYSRSAQTTLATLDLTAATAGAVDVWDRDWNLARSGETEYSPFYPAFRFPLESGKTWSGNATFDAGGGITLTHQVSAQVVGWERVTVPAGTFDAVKIVSRGNFHATGVAQGSGTINDAVWYAPSVRNFVKKEIGQLASGFGPASTGGALRNQRYERWELLEHKPN